MIRVGCVARGNDLAGARVLAATLATHHPEWSLTVLVLPGRGSGPHEDGEPFEVLRPGALTPRALAVLVVEAPPGAAEALARPLLLEHLLARGAERLLLLPADAEVVSPLTELEEALGSASAVVVPRLLGRLQEDGKRPDGSDLLAAGEIDDAVVAVRDGEPGRALVSWWVQRAAEAAEVASALAEQSPTTAQRLRASPSPDVVRRVHASVLGPAASLFPGVEILRHLGYDVSFWNLHERPVARDDGQGLTAGGSPLRLIRFPGFRADRPWWLSEYASRVLVLDDPLLAELCGTRAVALLDAGWQAEAQSERSRVELPNGLTLDARLRRLHGQALADGEPLDDVYSPVGAERFAAWLSVPAPPGAAAGLNRYTHAIWRERGDLRSAFPDLDTGDAEGYVSWLWSHGVAEEGLQEQLLPPRHDAEAGGALPLPPVLVAGYLASNLGLAQAARGYVAALSAAGVPVATQSILPKRPEELTTSGARRVRESAFEEILPPGGAEPEVNLLCLNPDQLVVFAKETGEDSLRSRHTIGYWAWETDLVPPSWDVAFKLVDELWVNSNYVAANLSRVGDVPVVVVPPPVTPPDPAGARVPFDLPDGFLFLFAFDFFSTMQRKNPLGVVEAFKLAFSPGEGPTLLLKTIKAEFRPEARDQLRHAIGERPDIRLVDVELEPGELAALFSRADCYVSLHRSEGFGLTLAESMALSKPVIATGYSGNLDFMTPSNSYLVDWRLTSVGPDGEHYPEDGSWAEPSLEHAASLMREVWENPETARRRGERAAEDVAGSLSVEAVGVIARARLERIAELRGATELREASKLLARVEEEVQSRFSVGEGERRGPRGVAKRALFRALRPLASGTRGRDEAVAAALRHLYAEHESDHAARARLRLAEERIAALEARIGDDQPGR